MADCKPVAKAYFCEPVRILKSTEFLIGLGIGLALGALIAYWLIKANVF
jgi:hypothetical protein